MTAAKKKRYHLNSYGEKIYTGTLAQCRSRRKKLLQSEPDVSEYKYKIVKTRDPRVKQRGLRGCQYTNPGGRVLAARATVSLKILWAISYGARYWRQIKQNVPGMDDTQLNLLMCRLVVRGLLQRMRVKRRDHRGRTIKQWRYTADDLPREVMDRVMELHKQIRTEARRLMHDPSA